MLVLVVNSQGGRSLENLGLCFGIEGIPSPRNVHWRTLAGGHPLEPVCVVLVLIGQAGVGFSGGITGRQFWLAGVVGHGAAGGTLLLEDGAHPVGALGSVVGLDHDLLAGLEVVGLGILACHKRCVVTPALELGGLGLVKPGLVQDVGVRRVVGAAVELALHLGRVKDDVMRQFPTPIHVLTFVVVVVTIRPFGDHPVIPGIACALNCRRIPVILAKVLPKFINALGVRVEHRHVERHHIHARLLLAATVFARFPRVVSGVYGRAEFAAAGSLELCKVRGCAVVHHQRLTRRIHHLTVTKPRFKVFAFGGQLAPLIVHPARPGLAGEAQRISL